MYVFYETFVPELTFSSEKKNRKMFDNNVPSLNKIYIKITLLQHLMFM